MDLIRELENKFHKIEEKLNSKEKQELIGGNYSNDIETINQLFELKEAKYKNGLNKRRDEMLKELINKRDEELNQVNHHPKDNRAQLKALDKSIKSKHFVFAKGLASIYESILFRSKFTYPFKFVQLVKYSKFMRNERKFCLPKANNLFVPSKSFLDRFLEKISFHVLSSDLVFIYKYGSADRQNPDKSQINMGILNHSGEIIHSKSILKDSEFLWAPYYFEVNATNIISLYKNEKILEIYNFKLELVHSIKLDAQFDELKLNNYEIAIDTTQNAEYNSGDEYDSACSIGDDMNKLIITCYNYQTIHAKKTKVEISLDENGFEQKLFNLVGVNDRFFFLGGKSKNRPFDHTTIICLLNREDENKIYKSFKCKFESCFVYNSELCGRFFYEYNTELRPLVYVYDINENDSNKSIAIRGGNIGKIAEVLETGNKYIYSKDTSTFTYKQY
jgi:hypothetical protein